MAFKECEFEVTANMQIVKVTKKQQPILATFIFKTYFLKITAVCQVLFFALCWNVKT